MGSSSPRSLSPDAGGPPTATTSPGLVAIDIPVVRGNVDGGTLLLQPKVGGCYAGADVLVVIPDVVAVDRAIDEIGGAEGWIEISIPGAVSTTKARLFHGRLEAAAVAFGGLKVGIGGNQDVWILRADGSAHQLVPLTTPAGKTAWMTTGSMAPC